VGDRNTINGADEKTQRPDSVNFGKWTAVIFVGNAIGTGVFVGVAGAFLDLPPRRLLLRYTLFLYCGLVLSPFLYWARLAREKPKSFAIRSAIAMFLYIQVIMLALGISTIKLGILSQTAVLNDYAPVMVPFTALISIVFYVFRRQMFKAR
jgi:hypothetical protein